MKITHYPTPSGPRANSAVHTLIPSSVGYVTASASGNPGAVNAHVTIRHEDHATDRTWRMELTPDEARTLGERLIAMATSAGECAARIEARAAP